jgi:tryptophan synthase beta chain
VANQRSGNLQDSSAFYDDLEKLLQQQVVRQPQLLDLRLRLAELYYETRKVEAFLQQARYVHGQIKGSDKSDEWRKILSMGRMIAATDALFIEAPVGDKIEFIGSKSITPTVAYTRIGEEERFRAPLAEIAEAYELVRKDPRFISELDSEMIQSAGHPSSLQLAERLSEHIGGARIYLKREDINTQPSHLLAAVLGQALLAKRMGKKNLVAYSANGRSGVVIAAIASRLGLQAVIYMDGEQMQLHSSNVFRMWLMGAHVTEAGTEGRKRSGDIRKEAWDHWAVNSRDTFLVMGLDAAPHPYPMLTLELAAIAGRECRRQLYAISKKAPDLLVARAGDNADAIGLFPPFLKAAGTRLVCVEGQDYLDAAAERAGSAPQSLTLQEQQRAALIMEGMDYPRTTREHGWLKASGRVEYVKGAPAAAKRAVYDLSKHEGVIPAIQTAYAVGWACQEAAKMSREQTIVVMIAEDVGKNIWQIGKAMGVPL